MEKLIITIAPTGNVPTKSLNPNTPITNDEILSDILKCEALGASIAHLHVRDSKEMPTSSADIFNDLLEKVNASSSDLITQLSTGARGGLNTVEYRGQMLELNCEMASLSTGSSNFPSSVNANSPELIEALANKMRKNNIKPEIEVFDSAMIRNANYLVKKGILKPDLHFNLVMNVPGSMAGTPKNLMFLIDSLPKGSTFTVSGIGKSHIQMLSMAILLGGHVRTGLEDVLTLNNEMASNESLIKQIVTIAKALKRPIATPKEARAILNL